MASYAPVVQHLGCFEERVKGMSADLSWSPEKLLEKITYIADWETSPAPVAPPLQQCIKSSIINPVFGQDSY